MIDKRPKNEAFIERFKQSAGLIILNAEFQKELSGVRGRCDIPSCGFDSHNEKKFLEWIQKQENDKFRLITTIFNSLTNIKCKPKYFLNKILYYIHNKNQDESYPSDLYFLENVATFNALIREKPFPGIVHYVLFNTLFIPESNELLLRLNHKYGYPEMIMGPNATMRDIQEFYPIINWLQKSKNYNKNKARLKRNYSIMHKIASEKLINYDILDEMGLDDKKSIVTKNLNRARQIKKRTKEYTWSG